MGEGGGGERVRIDERVTHLFISLEYRRPRRSFYGPMCSDRLGREMSTVGRAVHS